MGNTIAEALRALNGRPATKKKAVRENFSTGTAIRVIRGYSRLVKNSAQVKTLKNYLKIGVDGYPYGSNWPSYLTSYFFLSEKEGMRFLIDELRDFTDVSKIKDVDYETFRANIATVIAEAQRNGYGEELGLRFVADRAGNLFGSFQDMRDALEETEFENENININRPFILFEDSEVDLG